MCRKARFSNIAFEAALNSKQKYKHGAVVTKGSKIICVGHNEGMRTKTMGEVRSCMHAEIMAANYLVNVILKKKYGKKFREHTKKYTVWVIRKTCHMSARAQNNTNVYESQPCYYCLNTLEKLGFTKVGFSNENGDMILKKIKDFDKENLHKSALQLSLENFVN